MQASSARQFPNIDEYGIIGDCRTAALVSKQGSVEWLALPNFDSPPVFSSILDREKGGYMRIAAVDGHACSRRYHENSNVLETEFAGPDGRFRVIDFLPIETGSHESLQPERELIRTIEGLDGESKVEIAVAPRFDFGRRNIKPERRGRLGWAFASQGNLLQVLSDMSLIDTAEQRLLGKTRLKRGERRHVSICFTSREPAIIPPLGDEARLKLETTDRWWQKWSNRCSLQNEYSRQVRRSLLALKLLQFHVSGAVVAAATTSLPEVIGGVRNWDYRFCWLRDASFTLRAFADTGFVSEGAAFFDWMLHATRLTQPELQALYDVYGRTNLDEKELPELTGYCDSKPVRTGNAAHDQLQLDVYGAVMTAVCDFVDRGFILEPAEKRLIVGLGQAVCRQWRKPDNGIWEFRGIRRQNSWSKVMCWAALDALLRLEACGRVSIPHSLFSRERQSIRREVLDKAWNVEVESFTGALGENYVDATTLLWPRCHFLPAWDPRMRKTWVRIKQRLGDGDLIRRYEPDADALPGQEGDFIACAFWAVDYLARCGDIDKAKARFESLLGRANDLGLYSEEIAPKSGEFLGNFPQAFSHTSLVNAAFAIADAEHRRDRQ
jgi:GH15 family glucan-1,4-alpha-glucosidase